MNSPSIHYWKLIGFAFCAIYIFSSALHSSTWHFIDGVDLIIHEAGHPIFSVFGQTIGILGGTLMQIIVPLAFVIYFWLQTKYFETSIVMLWLGQSAINSSVYIADAFNKQLPLLGGDASIHDWNYLLGHFGVLDHATGISQSVYTLGFVILIAAVVLVIWKEVLEPLARF
jgi:hypothetical protein